MRIRRKASYSNQRQPLVIEGNELVVRSVVLPTELEFGACGLGIHSHSQLYAAGLGSQFTDTTRFDPVDYCADRSFEGLEGYINE